MITNGVAAAAGWLVDLAFGEPPARWHPVAWFGTAMGAVERRLYRDSRVAGVVRAAIESLAENTVDAVTAPLLWATVGGAPGVLAHRAINTLDAMVGHRNARYANFGWASAHVDDAVNWLPARLTALAVVAVRPRQAATVATVVRRERTAPSVAERWGDRIGVRRGPLHPPRRREQLRRRLRGPWPARRRPTAGAGRRCSCHPARPPHRNRVRRRVRDVAEHPTPRELEPIMNVDDDLNLKQAAAALRLDEERFDLVAAC